jgi:hypothetical protein
MGCRNNSLFVFDGYGHVKKVLRSVLRIVKLHFWFSLETPIFDLNYCNTRFGRTHCHWISAPAVFLAPVGLLDSIAMCL